MPEKKNSWFLPSHEEDFLPRAVLRQAYPINWTPVPAVPIDTELMLHYWPYYGMGIVQVLPSNGLSANFQHLVAHNCDR